MSCNGNIKISAMWSLALSSYILSKKINKERDNDNIKEVSGPKGGISVSVHVKRCECLCVVVVCVRV